MPRLPSSNPSSGQAGVLSETATDAVLASRAAALRDLEQAEQAGDLKGAAEARRRVREAQATVNRFGLEA